LVNSIEFVTCSKVRSEAKVKDLVLERLRRDVPVDAPDFASPSRPEAMATTLLGPRSLPYPKPPSAHNLLSKMAMNQAPSA
jgi:hypothetical protein